MSKEKLLVLQMLKEGKISEEEALKLLEAMGEDKNTKKNIGENKFKFLEDDFVSKITDSIASIGRRTQEAIQKINIEETISDIGSTFSKFKGKTEQVFDYDLEKSGDVDSIEVENYNGKITIHGLEDEEEELDEKKDPLDLEFAEVMTSI